MSYEDFVQGLDPKTAARVKTAAETEVVKYPLASRRLTASLGGGIAAGRVCTIFGNESAGKSLVSTQTIGMLQKQGLVCGYVDAEGSYEKGYGAKLGVNNKELAFTDYKPFKRAMDEFIPWIQGGIDVLVIDTVSALIPNDFVDLDDKGGDHINLDKMKKMMAHAKSTADMLRAIHMENEKTAVIILSQTTTSINQQMGYVEQVPHGGKRLGFDSSQIIRVTSSASDSNQIKGELQFGDNIIEKPIGREVDWFVKKNKLGRSHDTGKYNMYYAEGTINSTKKTVGIDRDQELIVMAGDYGILDTSSKGWYAYRDQKFRQKDLVSMIQNEPGFERELESAVHTAMTGEVLV